MRAFEEIPTGRVLLAPMAGVADRAFRELCRDFGAAMTVGEMVSCKGLLYRDKKSDELLDFGENERPIALQLFGDDPELLARAAEIAMKRKPDAIDLNMGCPAPKIAGNGCGSALLRDPDKCGEITRAVAAVSDVPVTVKIRKGWDEEQTTAVEVARACEQAGAAAITVHGRTRAQMYAPPVDLDIIRQVKAAVKIPVIGNGDIATPEDAAKMLEETGCDYVMVGRGALGAPWVFARINAWLEHERVIPAPAPAQCMEIMLRQGRKMCEYKGEYAAMREMRKHAAWYMKGFRGASSLRGRTGTLTTLGDLEALAEDAVRLMEQSCEKREMNENE